MDHEKLRTSLILFKISQASGFSAVKSSQLIGCGSILVSMQLNGDHVFILSAKNCIGSEQFFLHIVLKINKWGIMHFTHRNNCSWTEKWIWGREKSSLGTEKWFSPDAMSVLGTEKWIWAREKWILGTEKWIWAREKWIWGTEKWICTSEKKDWGEENSI